MKKLLKFIPAALLMVALAAGTISCTKNYYEVTEGVQVDVRYYYPKKSEFRWDDELWRWEVTRTDPDLTPSQVEDLEIAGTVVFGDVFCPMPFVDSYYYELRDKSLVHVVQNTGFEVTYGKVIFYIQTNEKDITYSLMLDEYEFKVTQFYK